MIKDNEYFKKLAEQRKAVPIPLPCPFCGRKPNTVWFARCGCKTQGCCLNNTVFAITEWNTRTDAPDGGGWIRVDEREPQNLKIVALLVPNQGKVNGELLLMKGKRDCTIWYNKEGDQIFKPTYWQPLPAPHKTK